jgi:hypothetical protein
MLLAAMLVWASDVPPEVPNRALRFRFHFCLTKVWKMRLCEEEIKLDSEEIVCEVMGRIHVAEDSVQSLIAVNTVINFRLA